jgi:hypothetical protein
VARFEQVLVTAEPFEPIKDKMLRVISEPLTVEVHPIGDIECYELQKISVLKKGNPADRPKMDPLFG